MDNVHNCELYYYNVATNIQRALTCWARSGDVMCLL
jgi:hypothetical protein